MWGARSLPRATARPHPRPRTPTAPVPTRMRARTHHRGHHARWAAFRRNHPPTTMRPLGQAAVEVNRHIAKPALCLRVPSLPARRTPTLPALLPHRPAAASTLPWPSHCRSTSAHAQAATSPAPCIRTHLCQQRGLHPCGVQVGEWHSHARMQASTQTPMLTQPAPTQAPAAPDGPVGRGAAAPLL